MCFGTEARPDDEAVGKLEKWQDQDQIGRGSREMVVGYGQVVTERKSEWKAVVDPIAGQN